MTSKVVVITGASQGIGYCAALELARNGFQLVLGARSIDKLEQLSNEIISEGGKKPLIYKLDVTQESAVQDMFSEAEKTLGRIDGLVNNAGYVEPVGILELSLENWSKTLNTNLTGTFLCTREFVRYNKKRGGKIINIASTAGMSPRPGWSAYAASKAGVINFSQTMSAELKPYGIKVYCIAPGRTATSLRKKLAPDEDQSKILQPESVANLIRYLFSDEADHIDQNTIVVRKQLE